MHVLDFYSWVISYHRGTGLSFHSFNGLKVWVWPRVALSGILPGWTQVAVSVAVLTWSSRSSYLSTELSFTVCADMWFPFSWWLSGRDGVKFMVRSILSAWSWLCLRLVSLQLSDFFFLVWEGSLSFVYPTRKSNVCIENNIIISRHTCMEKGGNYSDKWY